MGNTHFSLSDFGMADYSQPSCAYKVIGMPVERLQKVMARAGLGSRRECEGFIEAGRVTVNGKRAQLGQSADSDHDDIRLDGERLKVSRRFVYVIVNKPRFVISDEDVGGRYPSARELIPLEGHLYAVGRLDLESEGLMLFTNDGDLTHRLTHPSFEHPKTYRVTVEGHPSEKTLDAWRRGVVLDGKATAPAKVWLRKKTRNSSELEVTLIEGRKRILRRVSALLGHPVKELVRTGLGPLELGELPVGAWRQLTGGEVASLKALKERPARRRAGPRSDTKTKQRRGSKEFSKRGKAHDK